MNETICVEECSFYRPKLRPIGEESSEEPGLSLVKQWIFVTLQPERPRIVPEGDGHQVLFVFRGL